MTDPHEMLIVPGSARSAEGPHAGRPANLRRKEDYPVEGICTICGQVVRREKPQPGRLDWMHAGRMPGEP